MSLGSIFSINKIWVGYSAFPVQGVLQVGVRRVPGEIRAARSARSIDRAADGAKIGRRADRRRGFGLAAAINAFLRVSGQSLGSSRKAISRNGDESRAFLPFLGHLSSNRQLAPAAGPMSLPGGLDLAASSRGGGFPLSRGAMAPFPRRIGAAGKSDDFALPHIEGPATAAIRTRILRTQFGSGCGEASSCGILARVARFGGFQTGRGEVVHQLLSDGAKGATLRASWNRVN